MMRRHYIEKLIFVILALFLVSVNYTFGLGYRFEKLTDHCYYLPSPEGRENVAAVITEEGVLLVDPPSEKSRAVGVWDSLKNMASAGPVRWLVFTDPRYVLTSGARYFAEHGVMFLASSRLHKLSVATADETPGETTTHAGSSPDADSGKPLTPAWFIFSNEMRLFPSHMEIRVLALKNRARTAGDVFVFIPAEKVLLVGRVYEAGRYCDIDVASGGDAQGWIDGLKQIVESVPILKSAIPQPKSMVKTEPEKPYEEGVVVVPAFGRISNLLEVKDLLDFCQKLRSEVSRAIKRGRSCASFLASPAAAPFRVYANFDSYACRLFEASK